MGVNTFSVYALMESKLAEDKRFHAVDTKLRSKLFDEYCASLKPKPLAEKQSPEDEFKSWLITEIKDRKLIWEAFWIKYKRHPKVVVMEKKSAEKLFRNHIKQLNEAKSNKKAEAENAFKSLLSEQDFDANTVWDNVKSGLKQDPRYDLVASSTRRQELFDEHVTAKKKVTTTKAITPAAASEHDQVREKVMREHARNSYQQLLIDHVKSFETSFDQAQTKIRQDSRFIPVSDGEARHLYQVHITDLQRKFIQLFMKTLDELVPVLTNTNITFTDLQPALESHPKLQHIMRGNNNWCIEQFNKWVLRKKSQLRADLHELFHERTALLSYRLNVATGEQSHDDNDVDVEGSAGMNLTDEQEDLANEAKHELVVERREQRRITQEEAVKQARLLIGEDGRWDRMRVLGDTRERMLLEWIKQVQK
jgi:hypothetical protein